MYVVVNVVANAVVAIAAVLLLFANHIQIHFTQWNIQLTTTTTKTTRKNREARQRRTAEVHQLNATNCILLRLFPSLGLFKCKRSFTRQDLSRRQNPTNTASSSSYSKTDIVVIIVVVCVVKDNRHRHSHRHCYGKSPFAIRLLIEMRKSPI